MSLPEPYYQEDGITLYCGDCREILPLLTEKSVDLVLTDPPYGIGNFVQTTGNVRGAAVKWNESIPDRSVFDNITRIGKKRIIWGANYFNCFDGDGGAIIWDKCQPNPNFSKAEIASCSFYKKTEIVKVPWAGFVGTGEKQSDHPCERPVPLYLWCIDYAGNPITIADPFFGSGTSAVAAKKLGRKFIGIEISEKYCKIAVDRLRQMELFK